MTFVSTAAIALKSKQMGWISAVFNASPDHKCHSIASIGLNVRGLKMLMQDHLVAVSHCGL